MKLCESQQEPADNSYDWEDSSTLMSVLGGMGRLNT